MKRFNLVLGLLVLLLFLPAGIASAQGPVDGSDGGRVFTKQDVVLKPGETFEGDLSVIDGSLEMAEDSVVQGDVFVTGGRAAIAGQVNGNLAVLGGEVAQASSGQVRGDLFAMGGKHDLAGQVNGNVSILFGETTLRSSAVIRGDLLASPGKLTREEGAQVGGDVVTRLTLPPFLSGEDAPDRLPEVTPAPPATPLSPEATHPPFPIGPSATRPDEFGTRLARFAGRVLSAMLLSLLVLAVGALIVLVWPRPAQRVAECIEALPGQSFGLGLLTFLLAAGLEVVAVFLMVLIVLVGALLMATIILIPVGLLLILLCGLVLLPVPLALAGGVLLGWVGLAEIVGHKLLDAFHARNSTHLAQVLVGLLVTIVPAVLLWIIHPWCCGFPFVVILTSVGLGSVFHTRFGTHGCQKEERLLAPEVLPAASAGSSVPQPAAPEQGALPAAPEQDALPAAPEEGALPAASMDQEVGQPDVLPPPPPQNP